jgi:hypothetical protein
MMRHDKMLDVICEEIDKIADKGLTTGNLDTAFKLIDMYKDLKTVESMEEYDDDRYSQARGRMRAKRDSMGRYSRGYDDGNSYNDGDYPERTYMDSKRMYRNDHSMASKKSMLAALDDFMADVHDKLKEIKRDADTPEERDTIEKYVNMLERM